MLTAKVEFFCVFALSRMLKVYCFLNLYPLVQPLAHRPIMAQPICHSQELADITFLVAQTIIIDICAFSLNTYA